MVALRDALCLVCLAVPLSACAEPDDSSPEAAGSAPAPPPLAPAPASAEINAATVPAPAPEITPASSSEAPACPPEMARISRSCIDRYEAHLVTRLPDGQLRRHPHFERPEEGVTYEARSEQGVFPQAYISRIEAQAACAGAGKRLCSRREWQRACKGASATSYPYGQRPEPGRCNTEKPHLLTLRFGPDPTRWSYADFNDPILGQEPGFLARAGAHPGCAGEHGVYDMVGNLHEWVSDPASAAFKAQIDREGVPRAFQYWSPGNGVFMGGFYSTHGELGPGCTFTTVAHEPAYHDYSTGFRCCADAG